MKPIEHAIAMQWPNQKRIFMLTDGMVDNKIEVIKRSKGTNMMKIHAFGIGDGCDKKLVEDVATNGRGSFSLISDDKSHLVGARIIKALEKAFEPSFQNCKLVLSHGTTEVTYNLGEVFRNELIYKSLFMPEKDLDSFKLLFAFTDDTEKEHILSFDRSNLEQVQGDF